MINQNSDNIKTFPIKEKEGVLSTELPISNTLQKNQYVTSNILNLGNLRVYLNLKFLSLKRASQVAGISYSRIKAIITGRNLPNKPELIQRIAEAWDIDPIKLTQLFERMREVKNGN